MPLQSQSTGACDNLPGRTACGIAQGGGCCSSGWTCARNECIPPTGVTPLSACSTGSFLCAASLNYGCCANGLICGLSTCYPSTASSFVVTLTLLTTDAQSSVATTTKILTTALIPSLTPLSTGPATTSLAAIPKATPLTSATLSDGSTASIPKTTELPSQSSEGLPKGAVIGLIVGAVVVLFAVILATFLILRRLRAVSRKSQRSESTRGQHSVISRPAMARSSKRRRRSTPPHLSPSAPDSSSSPGPTGYYAVPLSDPSSAMRQGSLDHSGNPAQGYFDQNFLRDQNLWNGRPAHLRNISDQSNASVQAESTVTSPAYETPDDIGHGRRHTHTSQVSELEDTDRRSSFHRMLSRVGSRRRSLSDSRRSNADPDEPAPPRAPGLAVVAEGNGSQTSVNAARTTSDPGTQRYP
ncbi:MAG: hypothetical protein M1829_005317 [Trizodia sp. TS-e1964]|nr:MAG: hypothetical protein M1829_005317 [Trizodia sp. TS-e1964]